jgi:hypothetical protein
VYGAMRVVCVVGACGVYVKENANYWSSSHTLGMEMPLGAVNRSLGADAPRDLVCSRRLGEAREKEEVRQVASSCCRNG